jgi:hypothetical protein
MNLYVRVLMAWKLIAVLSVFFFHPLQVHAEGYYIERNGVIANAPQEDPSQEHPDVWRFRLYRKGESTSGVPWGGITGKTMDSILDELKIDQADELAVNRVCSCEQPGDTRTYFNPLGPIAVYYATPRNDYVDQADEIVGHLADLEKKFEEAETILGEDKVPNPFKVIDSPAWRFLKQLHETKEKFTELNNEIYAYVNEPLAVVNSSLESINHDLNNLDTLAPKMQESVKNGRNGDWMHFVDRDPHAGHTVTVNETAIGVSIVEHDEDGTSRVLTVSFSSLSQIEITHLLAGLQTWDVRAICADSGWGCVLGNESDPSGNKRHLDIAASETLSFYTEGEARDAYAYFKSKINCREDPQDTTVLGAGTYDSVCAR